MPAPKVLQKENPYQTFVKQKAPSVRAASAKPAPKLQDMIKATGTFQQLPGLGPFASQEAQKLHTKG